MEDFLLKNRFQRLFIKISMDAFEIYISQVHFSCTVVFLVVLVHVRCWSPILRFTVAVTVAIKFRFD